MCDIREVTERKHAQQVINKQPHTHKKLHVTAEAADLPQQHFHPQVYILLIASEEGVFPFIDLCDQTHT